MKPEQKLFMEANKLLGEYIGTLEGICHWDIPDELKLKLKAKVEELRQSELTVPDLFSLKEKMVEYLKTKNIGSDVFSLWCNAKDWARQKNYTMGGAYSSKGSEISVHLRLGDYSHRFDISLKEVAGI